MRVQYTLSEEKLRKMLAEEHRVPVDKVSLWVSTTKDDRNQGTATTIHVTVDGVDIIGSDAAMGID